MPSIQFGICRIAFVCLFSALVIPKTKIKLGSVGSTKVLRLRNKNKLGSIQKVLLLPQNVTLGITHHHKHIFLDGIINSDKLELTQDFCDPTAVWFVSLSRTEKKEWEQVNAQMESCNTHDRNSSGQKNKIILVDWSDSGEKLDEGALSRLFFLCSLFLGKDNIRYVTRQHVIGRDVIVHKEENENLPFKELGTARDWSSIEMGLGGKVKVARYGVRTDIVEMVESMVISMQNDPSSTDEIYALDRPEDVASFWSPEDHLDPVSGARSSLRAAVSKAVSSLASGAGENNLTVTTELRGDRSRKGRLGVHEDYVMALLQHKIVVTAQRDTYEDHYRLMEALVGGALVFTDPMHPLPYMLEDGKNVIMYSSISDLKEKILYYINDPAGQKKRVQIAKKGYEVVMNYHRSWHVMERLIFDDEGA